MMGNQNSQSKSSSLDEFDLTDCFEDDTLQEEYNIPPAFKFLFDRKIEEFDTSLGGFESVQSEPFIMNCMNFPILPREVPYKLLFMLGTHFVENKTTLNTHRNFWAYMMLECNSDTYNRFVEMHSDQLRERISPTC